MTTSDLDAILMMPDRQRRTAPQSRQIIVDIAGYADCFGLSGQSEDDCTAARPAVRAPLVYRHWRLPNRAAVFDYVRSLGEEACEWLCALYVDDGLNLLAMETINVGDKDGVRVDFGAIICRGRTHQAAGFILVHNHPSGDPRPSRADQEVTARLRYVSEQMEMPLLDHFIVAGDQMRAIGHW